MIEYVVVASALVVVLYVLIGDPGKWNEPDGADKDINLVRAINDKQHAFADAIYQP